MHTVAISDVAMVMVCTRSVVVSQSGKRLEKSRYVRLSRRGSC